MESRPPEGSARRAGGLVDWIGFGLLWGWIVLSLFVLPWLAGIEWLAAVLGLAGLVLCVQAARAKSHPVTTIGARRTVDREPITESGHDCAACGEPAGGGERRRDADRQVLFGSTVVVRRRETTDYCESCLEAGVPDEETGQSAE